MAESTTARCRPTSGPRSPAEEPIGLVTADGAHDTRPCHAAIAAREARAVIPTRRHGRPWQETTPGAQARHEIPGATRRPGRSIRRSWSGCHRRRRVEAKTRCLKRPGERLMARGFDRQTTAIPIRAALLNRFAQARHAQDAARRTTPMGVRGASASG